METRKESKVEKQAVIREGVTPNLSVIGPAKTSSGCGCQGSCRSRKEASELEARLEDDVHNRLQQAVRSAQ